MLNTKISNMIFLKIELYIIRMRMKEYDYFHSTNFDKGTVICRILSHEMALKKCVTFDPQQK